MKIAIVRITFAAVVLLLVSAFVPAQDLKVEKPRQEQLLNGLKVLIWSRSADDDVRVRLRIHNGASYDTADKEGIAALMADILFPDPGIEEFFSDDLGGSISIETTYDYIEISATASKDNFLTVLETLAPAISSPNIDKETTARVKDRRLERLETLMADPGYRASAAASRRLYGDFPYGRPVLGTAESVERIDFADLIFFRDRFFTADNATLTIEGDVRSNFAYLAARRLFGGWHKSSENIPATFRIPDAPPEQPERIFSVGENEIFYSYAAEAVSRREPGHVAENILARVISRRLGGVNAEAFCNGYFVKGVFGMLAGEELAPDEDLVSAKGRHFEEALRSPVTEEEFNAAKGALMTEIRSRNASGLYLDAATYGFEAPDTEWDRVRGTTLGDVIKAAESIRSRPVASVVLVARPAVEPDVPEDPKDPR